MFISKKFLSRRTLLRGLGAGVALPLLDAMVPASTALAQTAAKPVQRFGTFYVPHGAMMFEWMPEQVGKGFEFSRTLKPLEKVREYVNVMSGLYSEGPNAHSPTPGFLFAGTHAARATSEYRLNTTVDQMVAQQVGQETVFPSMEFAIEDAASIFGTCAADYLCLYMDTISWRNPTQPLPMEINPRVVFERMFGGDGATADARRIRLEQTTSVLDAVAADVHGLSRRLGSSDQLRLNEYLENVREVERRIVMGEQQRSERSLEAPPTPSGVPESYDDHVALMFELQALAFQGDLTRVTSFMLGRELSGLSFPQIGVADGHHPVSHNEYNPEQMEKKAKIDTHQVQLFANYLERLASTPDGDGSLLDHSLLVYGSGMSNGNRHDHLNLPVLVAGHAGGQLTGGRHLKLGDELPVEERSYRYVPQFSKMTPVANLMVSLLNLAGVETDKYGVDICESTGTVDLA
jgi:hypothetical protein